MLVIKYRFYFEPLTEAVVSKLSMQRLPGLPLQVFRSQSYSKVESKPVLVCPPANE